MVYDTYNWPWFSLLGPSVNELFARILARRSWIVLAVDQDVDGVFTRVDPVSSDNLDSDRFRLCRIFNLLQIAGSRIGETVLSGVGDAGRDGRRS